MFETWFCEIWCQYWYQFPFPFPYPTSYDIKKICYKKISDSVSKSQGSLFKKKNSFVKYVKNGKIARIVYIVQTIKNIQKLSINVNHCPKK